MRPLCPSHPPARVLITGGAGFIGSALARELVERGDDVLAVDDLSCGRPERLPAGARLRLADVERPGALAAALRDEGPFDALVHLAARVGVRAVLRDPEGCRRSNLAGARELVGAVAALPAGRRPRVLAASSSEVYRDRRAPLREGDPLRSETGAGRWAYAGSKLSAERLFDEARRLWSPPRAPLHLRFFNVVGPGQDSDSGMVLPTFVEHALAGAPIPVHGDGRQVRTFAHVDEVARVLAELLARDVPGGALNVGGRARASVLELARAVERASGSRAGLAFVDPRLRCGARFEEVPFREPCLERLAGLGIAPPAMGLDAIVRDALARHEVARSACASPAS